MGHPLSSLLLNMKSEDIGQGPARKSTVLLHWSSGTPPLPEFSYVLEQKALVLPRTVSFYLQQKIALKCPAVVLAGVPDES